MTPAQARKLSRDKRVESVSEARTFRRAAQEIPTGIRRIEATANPLADIDGVDERIDVDVMVIDELVAYHPDLNVASQADCVDGMVSGSEVGVGHGTHVAGTIGAIDNGTGVVGVAPGARIWSVNVFSGEWAMDSWIICALDAAAAAGSGIEVVNMSLGGAGRDSACGGRDAFHNAVCRAVAAGVTVVVAAGNEGDDAGGYVPATYEEVIAVSALDSGAAMGSGRLADFSNYGADVDIAAPGVRVHSTMPNGSYARMSGTSMASPHVAGAAALYLAQHPNATPAQVKQALLANRERISLPGDPDGIAEGVLNVRNLNAGGSDPNPEPNPGPGPEPDTTPPTVAIIRPRPNGRVKRTFTIEVAAADTGSGVAKVELFECARGCRRITGDTTAPYAMKVTGPPGKYRLKVRATDRAGNVAESPLVPVTIVKKGTKR